MGARGPPFYSPYNLEDTNSRGGSPPEWDNFACCGEALALENYLPLSEAVVHNRAAACYSTI